MDFHLLIKTVEVAPSQALKGVGALNTQVDPGVLAQLLLLMDLVSFVFFSLG